MTKHLPSIECSFNLYKKEKKGNNKYISNNKGDYMPTFETSYIFGKYEAGVMSN